MSQEPTQEEDRAIRALKRLAKKWPSTLWIFTVDGDMCIMRRSPDGDRARKSDDSIDMAYMVDQINIPNDGGL